MGQPRFTGLHKERSGWVSIQSLARAVDMPMGELVHLTSSLTIEPAPPAWKTMQAADRYTELVSLPTARRVVTVADLASNDGLLRYPATPMLDRSPAPLFEMCGS